VIRKQCRYCHLQAIRVYELSTPGRSSAVGFFPVCGRPECSQLAMREAFDVCQSGVFQFRDIVRPRWPSRIIDVFRRGDNAVSAA